jgi:hypothetical protein
MSFMAFIYKFIIYNLQDFLRNKWGFKHLEQSVEVLSSPSPIGWRCMSNWPIRDLNQMHKYSKQYILKDYSCSARDWDGKDYLRIIPRVVW